MAQAESEKNRLAGRERHLQEIQSFTLLSDVFASVVLKDIPACQHVLRILTGRQKLCLCQVKTQYSISRAVSRGARLDVFAEFLEKGKEYAELPELDIFYVSEKDIWKKGKTVYLVRNYLGDGGSVYEDGSHITFVNTEVDDQSEIAGLMQYFRTADPEDDSQDDLSRRVRYLKCEEGGLELMCDITDRIEQRGREEGRIEGKMEAKHESACSLAEMGMPVEQIARALKESVSLVQEWISEGAAPAK